jgi:hypothetical protein
MFHLKSNLAKNYLMSPLLHTIFIFLLNCLLLFLQQRVGYHLVYLYFYDPQQVINFNSLKMHVCRIISSIIIFLH